VFWYSGKYYNPSNSGEILASQLIYNSHFDLLAEIDISETSHLITFYNQKLPIGSQVLSLNWTENSYTRPTLEFALEPNTYFHANKKWEIFTTPFSYDEIINSLNQKNSISCNLKENNWIVVNWYLDNNKIVFLTLHSHPNQNLNIWSKSEYEVLSQKVPKQNSEILGKLEF
jgi:hypothetical protein